MAATCADRVGWLAVDNHQVVHIVDRAQHSNPTLHQQAKVVLSHPETKLANKLCLYLNDCGLAARLDAVLDSKQHKRGLCCNKDVCLVRRQTDLDCVVMIANQAGLKVAVFDSVLPSWTHIVVVVQLFGPSYKAA